MSINSQNQRLQEAEAGVMPKADEKLFHIHADIMRLGDKFKEEILGRLNFEQDNFLSREQIEQAFDERLAGLGYSLNSLTSGRPPEIHWTLKASGKEGQVYKHARDTIRQWMEKNTGNPDTVGYVETETVQKWLLPAPKDFDPAVPVPFDLTLKEPSPRKEEELHFCTVAERTDPRLIDRLVEKGLYAVMTPRNGGEVGIVLTAQGTHEQLKIVLPLLHRYLLEAGGYSADAKLMLEKIDLWRETEGAVMADVMNTIQQS